MRGHVSPGPHSQTQFQRRLFPRRNLHHGHHLHTHPMSWQRERQMIPTQQSRRVQYHQNLTCHHQEQGQPLLRSCHRHHEGLGGR